MSTDQFEIVLAPEVRDYSTPHFSLRDDLAHLGTVAQSDAHEAVVFYSGRILEVLANDALRRLGQEPSPNVFSNLQALEHFNRMGAAVRYWSHALRRLGNLVRHIDGRVGPDDASLAVLFAERILEWFFCRLEPGNRLPALTTAGRPFELAPNAELRAALTLLEQFEDCQIATVNLDSNRAVYKSPILLAVWAETLLSRKEYEAAFRALDIGMAHGHQSDLRLNQLLGLYWSCLDRFDTALECLQKAYDISTNDDETDGIVAGVYKRKWQAEGNRSDLEASHRTYRTGWRNSKYKNPYPGINTAATALWLGNRADAVRYAGDVEKLLRDRHAKLPPELRDVSQDFNFWDQVTLAEARLILGEWPVAKSMYQSAFAQFSRNPRGIESASRQARITLDILGIQDSL